MVEKRGIIEIRKESNAIKLYEHQQDAIKSLTDKILDNENFKSGMLVLPTGAGKTLTASYWLLKHALNEGDKVIWIAHRHELLDQAKQAFDNISYRDIASKISVINFRIISGVHDSVRNVRNHEQLLIASKASLNASFDYLKEWIENITNDLYLVIDEAHHASAKEYRELISKMRESKPNLKIIGLTATPFRTAEAEQGHLRKVFTDDIIYKTDLNTLVHREILSKPVFEELSTDIDMETLFKNENAEKILEKIQKDSFYDLDNMPSKSQKIIAENMQRNQFIVNKYAENKDKYGQTIVFTLNKDMAVALNTLFLKFGVKSDYIISKELTVQKRLEILNKFRNNEIEVLVNVNILTEGTDLPMVQTVFLARPTRSSVLMMQMIGRGLRGVKAGGTKEAYVVSFIDDWKNKIEWVSPEALFIDENLNFDDKETETEVLRRDNITRLISIEKIEEFARLANDTLDEELMNLSFVERIPIGIYRVNYLKQINIETEIERNNDIIVYDFMKPKYEEIFNEIENNKQIKAMKGQRLWELINSIDQKFFKRKDKLLGYEPSNIEDILNFYIQKDTLPEFIPYTDRENFDISKIAATLLKEDLRRSEEEKFIDDEWSGGESKWAVFFGIKNFNSFRKAIKNEMDFIDRNGTLDEILRRNSDKDLDALLEAPNKNEISPEKLKSLLNHAVKNINSSTESVIKEFDKMPLPKKCYQLPTLSEGSHWVFKNPDTVITAEGMLQICPTATLTALSLLQGGDSFNASKILLGRFSDRGTNTRLIAKFAEDLVKAPKTRKLLTAVLDDKKVFDVFSQRQKEELNFSFPDPEIAIRFF